MVGLSTSECRRLRADVREIFNILKGFEGKEGELFFNRLISNTK
jgi:hypothetical protein